MKASKTTTTTTKKAIKAPAKKIEAPKKATKVPAKKISGAAKLLNITEFTYANSSFEGYRVQLMKHGSTFRKYISRKDHGDDSQHVAIRTRETLLEELDNKRSWTKTAGGTVKPSPASQKRLRSLGFTLALAQG